MSSNVKLIIRFADSETSVSILCVAISYIKCSLEIPSQALPLSTSGDLDRPHDRVGQVVSPLTPGDCNDPHLFLGGVFFFCTLARMMTHMINSGSTVTSKADDTHYGFNT